MVIEQSDKIDIARILMKRIDGVVAQARVSTLILANAVLERWAAEAPENGEGHCQIQIEFEDGFQYRSQIGLKRTQKRISLAKLLRQQWIAIAVPQQARRKTKANTGVTISLLPPLLPLNAEAMLAKYDI